MAEFGPAIEFILANEGGWTDDPNDSGGATNFGITIGVARRHGIETKEELKAMPIEKAKAIYMEDYWGKMPILSGLKSQAVATKVFDLCVNAGVFVAGRVLQKAINRCGGSVQADGIAGPITLNAANQIGEGPLLAAFCDEQALFYWSIVRSQLMNNKVGWPVDLQMKGIAACDKQSIPDLGDARALAVKAGAKGGNATFIKGWLRRAARVPGGGE